MRELVLGCGHSTVKRLSNASGGPDYVNPTRLDIDPGTAPDVLWDLNNRPLPFPDETFDEIHAYHVLEHLGRQGDAKGFLEEFSEYWRLLQPWGCFYGIVPADGHLGAWGDPGHARVINQMTVVFLDQSQYEKQVGRTSMSDYRYLYKANFRPVYIEAVGDEFRFILKKEVANGNP